MLARMIAMEIRAKTRTILAQTALILLGLAYALLWGAEEALSLFPSLVCLSMWEYMRVTAYDEDISKAWPFLRSLPIEPRQIVSVRYVASILVFVAYGIVALGIIFAMPGLRSAVHPGSLLVAVGISLGVGLVLIGLSSWLYYRGGYRAVSTAVLRSAIPFVAIFLFLLSPLGKSEVIVTLFSKAAQAGKWLSAHPMPSILICIAVACCIVALSWNRSIASFSRKEF